MFVYYHLSCSSSDFEPGIQCSTVNVNYEKSDDFLLFKYTIWTRFNNNFTNEKHQILENVLTSIQRSFNISNTRYCLKIVFSVFFFLYILFWFVKTNENVSFNKMGVHSHWVWIHSHARQSTHNTHHTFRFKDDTN